MRRAPYRTGILALLEADAEAIVPALWPLEIRNALTVAERRKRITCDQAQELLADIRHLEIQVEPTTSNLVLPSTFDDIYARTRPSRPNAIDQDV